MADETDGAADAGAPPGGSDPVLAHPKRRALGVGLGLLMTIGAVAASFGFSFGVIPRAVLQERFVEGSALSYPLMLYLLGGGVALALLVAPLIPFLVGPEPARGAPVDGAERSRRLFASHLVGTGAALLIAAMVTLVYLCGLGWTEILVRVTLGSDPPTIAGSSPLFSGAEENARLGVFTLLLAGITSVLGSLFFFATRLWSKLRTTPIEPFRERVFWAGLWYRIGEAVLFGMVLYLVLTSFAGEQVFLLPLASVLVGMFLKPGERLITGIATRMFAAFEQLVPTIQDSGDKP